MSLARIPQHTTSVHFISLLFMFFPLTCLLFLAWIVLVQVLKKWQTVSSCCCHLKIWLVLKNLLLSSLTWLLSVSQGLRFSPHVLLHKLSLLASSRLINEREGKQDKSHRMWTRSGDYWEASQSLATLRTTTLRNPEKVPASPRSFL